MTLFDEKREPSYQRHYYSQLSERVCYYCANKWRGIQQISYIFSIFYFSVCTFSGTILFSLILVFKIYICERAIVVLL